MADFLIGNVKALLVVLIIGGIALVVVTGIFDKQAVPENRSSPGYQMVRILKSQGKIESFKAIAPESGWESEYDINRGDANILFSGDRMQISYQNYADSLKNAIDAEASAEGFTQR